MALETHGHQSTHRAIRLIGRFYRWVGCLGLGGTLLITIHAFSDVVGTLNHSPIDSRMLLPQIVYMAIYMALGLFISGLAFLVSVFLEGSSVMVVNSDTQTNLLKRLVDEVDETERLLDNQIAPKAAMSQEVLHDFAVREHLFESQRS